MSIDSSNNKWFGSPGGGFYKLENDSLLFNYRPENSPMPGYAVYGIDIDRYQNTWIAVTGGLVVFNENGIVNINKLGSEVPNNFILNQNYPNPFNPSTKIKFAIPKSSFVKLTVFDILGRESAKLVNGNLNVGSYEYEFDGTGLNSGVYFYRIEAGEYRETRRMVLVK